MMEPWKTTKRKTEIISRIALNMACSLVNDNYVSSKALDKDVTLESQTKVDVPSCLMDQEE